MKTILLGILVMGLACSAQAADKAQLNDRIHSFTAKFTAMEQNPATRVPANELARAQGIILLDRTRGAFFLGFHSGNGVALARDQDGHWSPAGFVSSVGVSLGPQIGGTKDFFVVLLTSPAAVETLRQPVMDFGAQASETGGSEHAGAEANLESRPSVVIYSQRNGVYAGASIKGGSVKTDADANAVYYDRPVSMDDILFARRVAPSQAEADLIGKIDEFSR
jgi:lipid-binding SYLF domain-containing protein